MSNVTRERYLSGRKKHVRRCAKEIEKELECPYAKCDKTYASEGSLNLHIKNKHCGGNKTDRERIAKSIVFAKANGIDLKEDFDIELNLPPGSIRQAADELGVTLDQTSLDKLEKEVERCNEINRIKQMKEELNKVQKELPDEYSNCETSIISKETFQNGPREKDLKSEQKEAKEEEKSI